MSKLVGASFIALGTGGIALALLKDTKYDPLVKLRITKPKIVSKVQQDFHCEVLFLKLVSNYYQSFEISKQIYQITKQDDGILGVKQLTQEEKNKVAELQAQHDKAYKIYSDTAKEFNESICGKEVNLYECINRDGNCQKTTEFNNDCVKNAIAYFELYYFLTDVEKDLTALNNADFLKKYALPKESYTKSLTSQKAKLEVLKKAYDSCDIANVDCASLKENIATLTDQSKRSGVKNSKIDGLQKLFDRTTCGSAPIVRTGVNYNDVRDCVQLDESIKSTKDEILRFEKKKLQLGEHWLPFSEKMLQSYKNGVKNDQEDFISKGCKGRLESEKLKDNAIILTDMSSQQEQNILKKNVTEQYAYIGIGGLVLVTGLFMVLKK
jgi:hypothetical protein